MKDRLKVLGRVFEWWFWGIIVSIFWGVQVEITAPWYKEKRGCDRVYTASSHDACSRQASFEVCLIPGRGVGRVSTAYSLYEDAKHDGLFGVLCVIRIESRGLNDSL